MTCSVEKEGMSKHAKDSNKKKRRSASSGSLLQFLTSIFCFVEK